MNWLFPKTDCRRVEEISVGFLRSQGIEGLVLDLDNTLASRDAKVCLPKARIWLEQLHSEGFRLILLSNARGRRVRAFQEETGIEAIASAMKPLFGAHRRAIRRLGLPAKKVAVIGDQVFTDILGGNMAGAYTILVEPLAQQTDFIWTKMVRYFERQVLASYFRKKK